MLNVFTVNKKQIEYGRIGKNEGKQALTTLQKILYLFFVYCKWFVLYQTSRIDQTYWFDIFYWMTGSNHLGSKQKQCTKKNRMQK